MVFALCRISGAQLNPAVSVALAVHGRQSWTRVVTYSGAQIVGAIAGAMALRVTLGPGVDLGVTTPSGLLSTRPMPATPALAADPTPRTPLLPVNVLP